MVLANAILIIINNAATRRFIQHAMVNHGYHVYEADSAKAALALLETTKPALIIQDVMLADHSSEALVKQIRNIPELKHIPIIGLYGFLLAQNNPVTVNTDGFNYILLKPIQISPLIEIVKAYLQASYPFSDVKIAYDEPSQLKLDNALLKALTNLLVTNRRNLNHAIEEILNITLDSAGISKAIFYLKNKPQQFEAIQCIGYISHHDISSDNFFGFADLLNQVASENKMMVLSNDLQDANLQSLLKKAHIKSGLLVPIYIEKECKAILYLGDERSEKILLQESAQVFVDHIVKHIMNLLIFVDVNTKLINTDKYYQILMQNAACGVLMINNQGIVVEVNPKLEQIFGYKREQIIGKTYLNFVLTTDLANANKILEKLLSEQRITTTEGRIQQANGSIREVEYSISVAIINQQQMYICILNDITEYKRVCAQVVLNDKLATIGTLTAGIVHEINNPVSWVLNNMLVLQERLEKMSVQVRQYPYTNSDPQTLQLINELQRDINEYKTIIAESLDGIELIRSLVTDLKSFARIDDKILAEIDIHDTVQSALKIATSHYKHKAKVEKIFSHGIPKTVLPRGKLQQVLLNIIVNAAQSLPERPLEHNIIQVSTSLVNNKIKIDIADNGPGIHPEILPKIFEPFFTTKPSGTGTGLGLSICYEIIASIGGTIDVKTELGKGTTFSITIPVNVQKKIDATELTKPAIVAGRVNILVVDDEPTLLKTIQRILEGRHSITIAHGGQLALDILEKANYQYDIIITDLNMPNINGMDLYEKIKQRKPGLEKHIIFMSGGSDSVKVKNFLSSVKNCCISKPFTKDELLHMVNVTALIPMKG